jgi:DnaJ-class molecular chaperone
MSHTANLVTCPECDGCGYLAFPQYEKLCDYCGGTGLIQLVEEEEK